MKANRNWNRHSIAPVKSWCHIYTDCLTGETIKVKGDSNGYGPDVTIFGNRNHDKLKNRKLRYEGLGFVNVTGFESAETVPVFPYVDVSPSDGVTTL